MRSHNIYFKGVICKIIPKVSLLSYPITFYGFSPITFYGFSAFLPDSHTGSMNQTRGTYFDKLFATTVDPDWSSLTQGIN